MNHHICNVFIAGWCAESVGARLEFMRRTFTAEEVNDAFHMTNNAKSGVNPGQITDDGEMEIALLSALIEGKDNEYFPLDIIAQKYIKWYKSEPFDIGQTTAFALLDATNATDLLTNANEYNMESESNGSLMRCIPLAVFGINKTDDVIMDIASCEAELTHPNKIVGEVTGLYCVVISNILRLKINNMPIHTNMLLDIVLNRITNQHIDNWFQTGYKLTTLDDYDCVTNEGHVKHAFIFFIYFLKNINEYSYVQAITKVIERGGDTDTNAKIVGNLFGAYYGDCVPLYLKNVVLNFDCTRVDNSFFKRPYFCSVKYALELLSKLDL